MCAPSSSIEPKRRGTAALRLAVLGLAALCLPASLLHSKRSDIDEYDADGLLLPPDEENGAIMQRLLSAVEMDGDHYDYRELPIPEPYRVDEEAMFGSGRHVPGRSYKASKEYVESMMHSVGESLTDAPKATFDPAPYTLADAVEAGRAFDNMFGVMVYDPPTNNFHFYADGAAKKLVKVNVAKRFLAYALRQLFPERFCGADCDEFAVALSGGDYPHLTKACWASFPHRSKWCKGHDVPVLTFGSAFRGREMLPNMLAMPMPGYEHITSFKDWMVSREVPKYVRPAGVPGEPGKQHFGKEMGLPGFNDLVPQVVWRGSDFGYLGPLSHSEKNYAAKFERDVGTDIADDEDMSERERKIAATAAMREAYGHLRPRWKGVVWTAEAENEVYDEDDEEADEASGESGGEGEDKEKKLPWANMKFYRSSTMKKHFDMYDRFEDVGIPATGERMSLADLGRYKYHIDIGGGGGTTWTGTMEKLAMPGLLFHHVTPTKDYIHYRLKPWYHYVPVAADMSDLKEKYDWAESHPRMAKIIAGHGAHFMRELGTREGYGRMFDEELAEPLRKLIGAYRPVRDSHPGMTWQEVVASVSSRFVDKPGSCNGNYWGKSSCNGMVYPKKRPPASTTLRIPPDTRHWARVDFRELAMKRYGNR